MSRTSLGRVTLVSVVLGASALANCVAATNGAPASSDDGGAPDTGADTAAPQDTDAGVDAAHLDGAVVDANQGTDSATDGGGAADAADASSALDAADAADATDAASAADAADAVDAAPVLDDAGCPVPTGVTVSLEDAGIPSTGVVLWLRSDIGVNTVNAVGDGGSVCRWDDVSGNGQSFTPASATPPTMNAGGFGTTPAVSFNGSAQNLSRAGVLGIGATSARTVAVYSQTSDTTNRFESFFQGQDGSPGTYFGLDANTYMTAGSLEGVYVTNNSFDSDIATTTSARTHILSISSFVPGTALPGALVYAVDGTPRTLTLRSGSGTVEDFSAADFTSVGYGAAGFTGGLIGEVIVYDRELSALERAMIEQHFATRF